MQILSFPNADKSSRFNFRPKPAVHATLAVHGMILAFNKPYGILSQFTKEAPHHRTLAESVFLPACIL